MARTASKATESKRKSKKPPKPKGLSTCSLCSAQVPNIMAHRWAEHREQMEVIAHFRDEANPRKQKAGNEVPSPSGQPAAMTTGEAQVKGLAEAVSVNVVPKPFTMTSSLIWQARIAAIQQFGWNEDITPSQFLDAWLFISFKQRGVLLGGYTVLAPKRSGGNGQDAVIGGDDEDNGTEDNGTEEAQCQTQSI